MAANGAKSNTMPHVNRINRRALLRYAFAAATTASAWPLYARSQPAMMRAWEMGDATAAAQTGYSIRLVQRPVPEPGPGQVLMKVHATGLNARDLSLMSGVRIYGSQDIPTRIPLDDNAGQVVAVGPDVGRVKLGDRVVCTHFPLWVEGDWDDATMSIMDFGVNTDGFLAEYAVVPAQGLVRIPDSISSIDAATFPNAGLTAWHAVVVDGEVQAGETVLTLGSGGVSVFGMQWAKMRGARVIITSSSDDKLARLRELGADDTINYRTHPDWHEKVLEKTAGRGVDAVLNTVGIGEMERCLKSCASNGRVMLIGANPVARGAAADSESKPVGMQDFPRDMIMKGLTIKGVIVGSRCMLQDLVQAAADHDIRPVIDRVYPFEQALDAVRYMASGQKIGKVAIEVSG